MVLSLWRSFRSIRTLEAATVRITDMQMECGKHGEEVAVRDRHNKADKVEQDIQMVKLQQDEN